tara:strand:+ start:43 stop:276 length:234 start_codon:yes stop_codon:yes gene_type:complete
MKKIAHITYTNNYGGKGSQAWLIQESYNGKISDPYSHKVLKREHFNRLQEVILDYLEKGFKVEGNFSVDICTPKQEK